VREPAALTPGRSCTCCRLPLLVQVARSRTRSHLVARGSMRSRGKRGSSTRPQGRAPRGTPLSPRGALELAGAGFILGVSLLIRSCGWARRRLRHVPNRGVDAGAALPPGGARHLARNEASPVPAPEIACYLCVKRVSTVGLGDWWGQGPTTAVLGRSRANPTWHLSSLAPGASAKVWTVATDPFVQTASSLGRRS